MQNRFILNIAAAVFFLLLAALLLRAVTPPDKPHSASTWLNRSDSYNSAPKGFRAFFDLLVKLKVPAERFEQVPLSLGRRLYGPGEAVFLLLHPDREAWEREKKYLLHLKKWVRDGGVLLVAHDRIFPWESLRWEEDWDFEALNAEEGAVVEKKFGAGTLLLVSPSSILTNERIGEKDFAWAAYRWVTGFGERTVLFDEFYHGIFSAPSLFAIVLEKPWVYLLASFLLALLFFSLSRIFSFGPPEKEPVKARPRSEYLGAMASLYKRVSAHGFVLGKIAQGYQKEIGVLSVPLRQERLRKLLEKKERLEEGKISSKQLYHWTREIHALYKEQKRGMP